MRIAIKENEIDKISLASGIKEETLKLSGFSIVDIANKYSDCDFCDFDFIINDYVFSIEKYNARKQNDTNKQRIAEIQPRLNELSQDFIQADLGADFGKTILEDGSVVNVIDLRKKEFKTLHNELRVLLNKEPRIYI